MSRESIMDMDLSGRIREIQNEEGRINRGPVNIAGPAGNPTQPLPGHTHQPYAFCGSCGTDLAHGMPHAPGCSKNVAPAPAQAQTEGWDYCCG